MERVSSPLARLLQWQRLSDDAKAAIREGIARTQSKPTEPAKS